MIKKFYIQGSAPSPYEIVFYLADSKLRVLCSCPAGERGQACKHRLNLIQGNPEGIMCDSEEDIIEALSWVQRSQIPQYLEKVEKAEKEVAAARKELAGAKKGLGRVMQGSVILE